MGLGQRIQLHLQPARLNYDADGKPRRWIQRTIMGWCAQEVDVSKLNAKCLMQRKWVPIKDDVTYLDNKNEAEGIYI